MWIDVQSHISGLVSDIMSMPSKPGYVVRDILARYLLVTEVQ